MYKQQMCLFKEENASWSRTQGHLFKFISEFKFSIFLSSMTGNLPDEKTS